MMWRWLAILMCLALAACRPPTEISVSNASIRTTARDTSKVGSRQTAIAMTSASATDDINTATAMASRSVTLA